MTLMAKFIREKKSAFREYLQTSLDDYYVSPGHRWLVYALTFIISGGGAFLAGTVYDFYDPLVTVPLTFKGMYAWHTAANFALWLCVSDIFMALAIRPWGSYDRRTVGKVWILFLVTYLVGFISQRTIVYRLIILYAPALVWVYEINPSQRTPAWAAFLINLPFVLLVYHFVMRIIMGIQQRSEEFLRVRVDAILEERARKRQETVPTEKRVPVVKHDDPLDLPLDQGQGPIRASWIEHVTVEDHYLRIHYYCNEDLHSTLIRMPLRKLVQRLPKDQFVQIHRSHLVGLKWISGLKRSGRKVRLSLQNNDTQLPVSRHRLPHLLPVLDQYLTK